MALIEKYTEAYQLENWLRGTCYENSFSRKALEAIIEYFEEFDDTEIDIAIFSEFSEEPLEEICGNYSELDDLQDDDSELDEEKALDIISNNTFCRKLSNGNILYIPW